MHLLKTLQLSISFILAFTVCSGCVERIDFDSYGSESRVVVDGYISDQFKTHEIKVSYSSTFQAGIFVPSYIEDAQVLIESVDGEEHRFSYIGYGIYRSEPFAARPGIQYRSRVILENESYSSEYAMLPHRPEGLVSSAVQVGTRQELSSTGRSFRSLEGVNITAQIQGQSQSTYYRWQMDTYHLYVAPRFGSVGGRIARSIFGDENIITEPEFMLTDEQIDYLATKFIMIPNIAEKCYIRNFPEQNVSIHEDVGSSPGVRQDLHIGFIGQDSKFRDDYALRLSRLVIDRQSFDYWRNIKSQFEDKSSGVFQRAPATVVGNVLKDNSDERALGYFGVYREDMELFFFNDVELGLVSDPIICDVLPDYELLGRYGDCVSCLERLAGREVTHKKPDWWR